MTIYRVSNVKDIAKEINELMVSSFLIEGKDKAVLLDTGMDIFNIEKFVSKLTSKELIVVNSHFHPDHSNGNHKFKEIYIGKADVPTFTKKDPYFKLVDDISQGIFAKGNKYKFLKPIISKFLMTKKGNTKYKALKDGEKIDLGDRKLIVKNFPGHTPGSITLLDKDNKFIFMGDACNMGTWMWTNPDCNLHDYARTARKYYDDVKKDGYKKIRGSHVPLCNDISFIKDYANWVDTLTEKKALKTFNMPGARSKFCIAVKPSLKHGMFTCFYFAHQCEKG